MANGILADLDDPNRPRDNKPVHNPTAEECRREWEEQRAFENEIQALVNEAMEGRTARHLAGERQLNEARIAAEVDGRLVEELIKIAEKRFPPERVRKKLLATFREFSSWCRENGVDPLPATGPVTFAWLVSDNEPKKLSQRARALRFVHDINREYLDTSYIVAAERWARITKTKKESENSHG